MNVLPCRQTMLVCLILGFMSACGSANPPPSVSFPPFAVTTINANQHPMLMVDAQHHAIQQLDPITGQITALAGLAATPGKADGLGTEARFRSPSEVVVSRDGGFALVADTGNHTIRRIDLASGLVTTVAGLAGLPGASDGVGLEARFYHPYSLTLSQDGTFALVADTGNHTLRQLDLETGQVSTLAGQAGISGERDGVGLEARFYCPHGIALYPSDAFALIADYGNGSLRRIDLDTAQVSTLTRDPTKLDPEITLERAIDVDISPDGAFALVVDVDAPALRHLSLLPPEVISIFGASNARQMAIPVDSPRQVSLSADGDWAVVLDGSELRGVNLATGAVTMLPSSYLAEAQIAAPK